jgi:D-alanine-D-alanine ligase
MKKNIAIVTGGDVAERNVSLQSAGNVASQMNVDKYNRYIIELNRGIFTLQGTSHQIDLNDFSLLIDGDRIHFDLVYLMLHGHPAEDGHLQGYFKIIGMPFTGCHLFTSAVTFGKQATKDILKKYKIPMAASFLITKTTILKEEELLLLGLPLFVKPNKNGSSFGVSKVKRKEDLKNAIQTAFEYDDEVVVEAFLSGPEFSNGVFRKGSEIIVLPITEIISENEFFDYQAKYENQSQEITPARLSEELTQKCKAQSKLIYEALGCSGVVRVDSIAVGDDFYFLEVNTIPGMSDASIIPQQVKAYGMTVTELLDSIIEEALSTTID